MRAGTMMTDKTNGAKEEEKKNAQDERAKKRRRALSRIAAGVAAVTALTALIGVADWTPFWATVALYYGGAAVVVIRGRHVKKAVSKGWSWLLIAAGTAALGILQGQDAFEWIVGWLRRYEVHTPWAFCWRIALESLGVKIALTILLGIIDGIFKLGWTKDEESDFKPSFALLVFHAPIIETLISQAIPIALLSWLGASIGTQVAASGLLFAAAHFDSIPSGLIAGISGGVYLGYTYAYWLQTSFRKAFWITALFHALSNLPVGVAMKITGWAKKKKERHESEDDDD